MTNKIQWKRICSGQYQSKDGRYWLIHHRYYYPEMKKPTGFNVMLKRKDSGWDSFQTFKTLREAKLFAERDSWRGFGP